MIFQNIKEELKHLKLQPNGIEPLTDKITLLLFI